MKLCKVFCLQTRPSMTLTAIKYCRDTGTLSLLDQRLLPASLEYVECRWRLPRPRQLS